MLWRLNVTAIGEIGKIASKPTAERIADDPYADWTTDVHVPSIPDGADICPSFLVGAPTRHVRCCELQAAMTGPDVAPSLPERRDVFLEPGELVCRNAHCRCRSGWDYFDGARFHAACLERVACIWAQGEDLAERPSAGFLSSDSRTRLSIEEASASAQPRFSGRSNASPKFLRRCVSCKIGKAVNASCFSSSSGQG